MMMDRWVHPGVPSDPSSPLGVSGEPSAGRHLPVASSGHNDRVHDDLGQQQRDGDPTDLEAPEAPEAPEVRMLASRVVYADQWIKFSRNEIVRNYGTIGTY